MKTKRETMVRNALNKKLFSDDLEDIEFCHKKY